ncbi:hypothetical protein AMTR_s00112p00123120 [Amborella trichopoda]|uniref:Uncharacterized protein n=1 Tax=Amborella trichopoda TaxID=13333 RepID=W1NXQ7_AMBTC|nr:hypothetical protein AMTR_s00112p00123120 [Amborella trichopoda]
MGQLARGDGSGRDGAVRRPKWDSRLQRGEWGRRWLASGREIGEAVGTVAEIGGGRDWRWDETAAEVDGGIKE